MIFVEFCLDHPILRETLEAVPEMQVEWVEANIFECENRQQNLAWVWGGDFETFETILESDTTITTPLHIITIGDRRLYRLDTVNEGFKRSLYSCTAGIEAQPIRIIGTHEGWNCCIGFPNLQTASRFLEFCSELDPGLEVCHIYAEQPLDSQRNFGLTDFQREILLTALEIGYLEVPRLSNLQDLGDQFDISDSAASQRFRRGVKHLIQSTIADSNTISLDAS